MKNVILVVGGTSGIGREIARIHADRGDLVAVLGRREDRLKELEREYPGLVRGYVHDVTDLKAAEDLFQTITRDLGGFSRLYYCAGAMPEVSIDEYSTEKDALMINTNVAGAVAWLNQGAIRIQETGFGEVVALGSVAGDRGRAGQPVYNASKAFLESYMESLEVRLSGTQGTVSLIKPGPTQSEMTDQLEGMKLADTRQVAERCVALGSKTGAHYVSPVHAVIFWIIRKIPRSIFRKLKI
jgi:decaprenylphospho-beta-D-erythro-pentofuranosid-2-ulose 2-reductase